MTNTICKSVNYHAIPSLDGKWAVRKTLGKRATAIWDTKHEAWHDARRRARAQGGKAYLHGKDGRIVTRACYG